MANYMKAMTNERGRYEIAFMDQDGQWSFEANQPDFTTKREADEHRRLWILQDMQMRESEASYRRGYEYACGYRD